MRFLHFHFRFVSFSLIRWPLPIAYFADIAIDSHFISRFHCFLSADAIFTPPLSR